MCSIIQYIKVQLKQRFISSPKKSCIYYLSPVILFIISWIVGKCLNLKKENAETNVSLHYILISAVAFSLYIVLSYRMAYEIIYEKAIYRKQHMYTYGFNSLKFHLAWTLIYVILILPSSMIITGLVYFTGIFPKIDLLIIFLSLYFYQIGIVSFSLWVSSYFQRYPSIGGIISTLFIIAQCTSYTCNAYFYNYKRGKNKIESYNSSSSIAYIIYEMKNTVNHDKFINLSNIFSNEYYTFSVHIILPLGQLLVFLLFALCTDFFFISIHITRKKLESIKKSYYKGLLDNKLSSKPEQINNSIQGSSEGFFDWKEIGKSFKLHKEPKKYGNDIDLDKNQMMENDSAIIVKNIFKKYSNGIMAINNASFNIYPNEIFIITGPKNSGKSTLMKMLYGRHRSSYGNVYYNCGKEILKMDYWKWSSISRNISVAPKENYMFMEDLSVSDNIKLYSSMCSSNENGFTLLNELNFLGNTSDLIKNLDEIEKMKVKITLAIMKFQKYIFLEEPTTGMSDKDKLCFWKVIRDHKSQHVIIISTESLEEASQQADRVLLLNNGMIQYIGENEYLKNYSSFIQNEQLEQNVMIEN